MNEIKYLFERCKACDGPIRLLPKPSVDGLDLAKCRNCGLLFVQKIPVSRMWVVDDPEEIGGYYDHQYQQVPPKFRYGLDRLLSYFKERGGGEVRNLQLLDVGCGDGTFCALAQSAGFQAAGTEQHQSCIEICKKRGIDRVYSGDLSAIEDQFDAITLFDVAEHLEDAKGVFDALHRRLKPNGALYLETPRQCLADHYMNGLSHFTPIRNNRVSRDHVQIYSDKGLRLLLERSGFEVLRFEAKQSLSWTDRKQYLINMGVKSERIAEALERVSRVIIALGLLGRNKAIVLARRPA
jgi:SAM-dependent methyltransferase